MPRWYAVRRAAALVAAGLLLCAADGAAQTRTQRSIVTTDVAVSYVAARSLQTGTNQNFWMNGGAVEVGSALRHGLGPAVDVTGTTASHVGNAGVPLSLVTFTVGPRYRFRPRRRVSPFGQALFGFAHGFDTVFPGVSGTTTGATSFALQAGGGLDFQAGKGLFVRPVDLSYLRTQLPNGTDNVQNTLRLGFGIGLTFGTH